MKKKLPYSFGVVAIVALIVAVFIVVFMAMCLSNVNHGLEDRLTYIENAINDAVDDFSSQKLLFEQLNTEINVLKEQYDSFVSNLTIILSVFALLVTICTILMPLYTYNFLQKDQITSFHEQTDKALQSMKDETQNAVANINNQIASIRSVEENFKKWIDELFSPLDFSEIRIEPIYNISKEESDSYYRKAYIDFSIGKTNNALEKLNLILKSDSKNEKTLLAKAQVLYSLEDYDEASNTMDLLLAISNNPIYYYVRGCIKFQNKNYNAAVSDFFFVYNKRQDDEQNLVKLAAALHKNRQTKDAIHYQTLAIQCNGNIAQYYADRGIMYHALKDYPAALSDKKQAIELSKDNGQYYGICAATLYKLKEYDNAIKHADIAISKDEKMAFAYSFRGLAKAHISEKFSRLEAAEDLNMAINLDNSNHRNFNRRAEFYIKTNEMDDAIKDLDEAYKIDPLDPEIMHLYFLAYKTKGVIDTAESYQIRAKQLGYIPEP